MDVRDTPISDSDIQCFNITSTLREILMDCPVEFRDQYVSSDEASDTDDGESVESKTGDTDSSKGSNSNEHKPISGNETISQRHDDAIASESESDSADESECSTDSEDGNSDGEDGAAKVSGNNDEANPPQAHCIQVVLQNGRMINVNAERSNDSDNPLRETNGLRCVIGIINGRGLSISSIFSYKCIYIYIYIMRLNCFRFERIICIIASSLFGTVEIPKSTRQ